jgi:hypothetical protein
MKHTSIHGTKSQTCPQLPYMAQTCPQNILSRLLWRDKILHARKDLMGGCIPKFGPPSIPGPPKKIFQNNFIPQLYSLISPNNFIPEISKIFSEEILHLKKNLQFQNARAPSPQVGPPFFSFNPPPPPPPSHTPPGGTALGLAIDNANFDPALLLSVLLIYINILLNCDWLISVQLIPNSSAIFCNHSAIFCNHSAKICNKLIWLVGKHCDD